MKIISRKLITDPMDIMRADIIDFGRLNGYFENSAEALNTIFSWFNRMAVITHIEIDDFLDAPKRNDWPGWEHVGNHSEWGEQLWNWFHWKNPAGEIMFSDSPDFRGFVDKDAGWSGPIFHGDLGLASPIAFVEAQSGMRAHDLWVTHKNDRQICCIEPQVSIVDLRSGMFTI